MKGNGLNICNILIIHLYELTQARQDALIEIADQMDYTEFKTMTGFLDAVYEQAWDLAATELLRSNWGRSNPRAVELAEKLKGDL